MRIPGFSQNQTSAGKENRKENRFREREREKKNKKTNIS